MITKKKTRMCKFYFFIFLLFFPITLCAQSITGKVVDNDSLPIEFVNIILLQSIDSSFVVGTVTDTTGNFSFPVANENYLLKVNFLGFQTQIFELKTQNTGTIYLQPEYKNLQEVTIAATRPFIKGKTVLIITHRLSTVKSADQIIVLKNGQIIEQGTHMQLVNIKKGIL